MLSVKKSFEKYEEESDFMYNLYDSYSKKEIKKINGFINRKIREFSVLRKRKNNLYIHSLESYEFQDNKRIIILIHNSKLTENNKNDNNTIVLHENNNENTKSDPYNNTIAVPASGNGTITIPLHGSASTGTIKLSEDYGYTESLPTDENIYITTNNAATTDSVVNYVNSQIAALKEDMRFKDPLYEYILGKLKVNNSDIGLLEMIVAIELGDNEVSTISLKDSKFNSLYISDVKSIKNLMRTTLREYPSMIFKKKMASTDTNSDTVTEVPTSNEKENAESSVLTPNSEENASETPENNNEVKS